MRYESGMERLPEIVERLAKVPDRADRLVRQIIAMLDADAAYQEELDRALRDIFNATPQKCL